MPNLSPELEELVLASRSAAVPTAADSARVLSALRVRLGDAAFAGAETAQVAASSMSSGLLLGKAPLMSLAGLAVLGGLWFFTSRDSLGPSREPTATVAVAAANTVKSVTSATSGASSSTLGSPEPQAPAAVAVASVAEPTEPRPVAKHRVRDRLAEEVALLSRAESALHNGSPSAALDVLNEHERKFGNGLLAEERIAARIQALCALGRVAEADVQLARLSRSSLHGQPSRQACALRKNN